MSAGRLPIADDVLSRRAAAAVVGAVLIVTVVAFRVDRADAGFRTATTTTSSSSSTTTTTSTTVVTAGGTATSDGTTAVPDATNKVVVSVTSPTSGSISFAKTTGTTVTGYKALAGVTITAPAASTSHPLRMTFSVDMSTLPATLPIGGVTILRDSAPAGECTSVTEAAPDPCVVSRSRTGSVLKVTVLSSHASAWTMARQAVQRVNGDSRVTSAIAASRSTFADQSATAVVIVRSDGFADALAATPLAVAKHAPLLLTGSQSLDDDTLAEVIRVLPKGSTAYLLGGTGALSQDVSNRLVNWGYKTQRYAGNDRYETAAIVAEQGLSGPNIVVETTGLSFADALAAGAVAAKLGGAVLLTKGAQQSDATAGYLKAHAPTRYALGAPAAAADRAATAFAGDDRYETAVLAAIQFFPSATTVGVASGTSFADALAGGVHIATAGGPLLLVPQTGSLPIAVVLYLQQLQSSPPAVFLYGGSAAVGDDIAAKLQTAAGL